MFCLQCQSTEWDIGWESTTNYIGNRFLNGKVCSVHFNSLRRANDKCCKDSTPIILILEDGVWPNSNSENYIRTLVDLQCFREHCATLSDYPVRFCYRKIYSSDDISQCIDEKGLMYVFDDEGRLHLIRAENAISLIIKGHGSNESIGFGVGDNIYELKLDCLLAKVRGAFPPNVHDLTAMVSLCLYGRDCSRLNKHVLRQLRSFLVFLVYIGWCLC